MNTLTTTLCTTLLLSTAALSSTTAEAAQFVAADNSPSTQLCMAVTVNKPIKLMATMKDLRISKKITTDKLRCNDMNVAQFTATYGFNKAATYLNIETSTDTEIQDLAKLNQQTILVIAGSK